MRESFVSRVLDEVRSALAGVTRPGLVAVSGGPDSVALLLAMREVCPVPFTAVHVNHELRVEESDGDEAFVKELAGRLGVPFRAKRLPIPDGASVESTARDLRYGWFREVAKETYSPWVATGHTRDDHAETILFRIVRGTGLSGLMGIPSPGTVVPGLSAYRPLLRVRRADVVEYLKQIRQPFRTDSSNDDLRFTRNRIRHELVPLLETMNPNVVDSLARLAEHAADATAVIDGMVQSFSKAALLPPAGDTIVIDATKLESQSPPLVAAFFRSVWQSHDWPAGEMSASHWKRLAALTPGDYPGGVSLRVVGQVVQLRRKS
jgi:tRNA(Ile)-lysidine synthase